MPPDGNSNRQYKLAKSKIQETTILRAWYSKYMFSIFHAIGWFEYWRRFWTYNMGKRGRTDRIYNLYTIYIVSSTNFSSEISSICLHNPTASVSHKPHLTRLDASRHPRSWQQEWDQPSQPRLSPKWTMSPSPGSRAGLRDAPWPFDSLEDLHSSASCFLNWPNLVMELETFWCGEVGISWILELSNLWNLFTDRYQLSLQFEARVAIS